MLNNSVFVVYASKNSSWDTKLMLFIKVFYDTLKICDCDDLLIRNNQYKVAEITGLVNNSVTNNDGLFNIWFLKVAKL